MDGVAQFMCLGGGMDRESEPIAGLPAVASAMLIRTCAVHLTDQIDKCKHKYNAATRKRNSPLPTLATSPTPLSFTNVSSFSHGSMSPHPNHMIAD